MSPKREDPAKKQKVVAVDEDVAVVEKKSTAKRGRPTSSKSQSTDKKVKIIHHDSDDDDDDDNDDADDDNNDIDDDNDDADDDNDEDDKSEHDFESKSKKVKKSSTIKVKKVAVEKVKTVNKKTKNDDDEIPPSKRAKVETKMLNPTHTDLTSIDYDCDKVNKKGQKYNLKICSWNVAGIRALIKKNGMDYLKKEDADIIAIQETKCSMEKLPDEIKLPGYDNYFLDSEKSGYCGMALYCKNDCKLIDIKYGLNNTEFDKDGRLITAEFDNFYLINVYVPNAGLKLIRLAKRLKWNEKFQAYVKQLNSKKPVIICGDMNVAHQEIDLTNPKANVKNAGFSQQERDGMTDLLNQGFVDTFRQLYPDKTGAYTFWSYFAKSRSKNIGWRLDYFIVSERIKENICDNVIRSSVNGSDHCPIILYANL